MQRSSTETPDPKDLETLEQFKERMKPEGKTFKPAKHNRNKSHVRHVGGRAMPGAIAEKTRW